MIEPPPSPPISADGRLYWDGERWAPVPASEPYFSQGQSYPWATQGPGQRNSVVWPIAVGIGLAVAFVLGVAVGLPIGRSTLQPVAVSKTQKLIAYEQVRQANLAPLEQALANVNSDCKVDDGRCGLSLAYVLALDQKFLDELNRTAVPDCASGSDQRLREGLRRLQVAVSDDLATGNRSPGILDGSSDIFASEQMYNAGNCVAIGRTIS